MSGSNFVRRDALTADMDRAEFNRGVRIHLMVLAASGLLLAAAGVFTIVADISGGTLTREPQITLGGAVYTGAISNLGALIWMVGVVMAAVGWSTSTGRAERSMFLSGAVVGLVFLVDDFFLVHDWVEINRDGPLVETLLASYFLAAVIMVAVHRRTLGPLSVAGLVVALGLLALSGLFDAFFNSLDQLVEDGFKFAGICTWATVWTLRAQPWKLRPPIEVRQEANG